MKTSPGLKLDPAKVSTECRKRNPHIFGPQGSAPIVEAPKKAGKRRKQMNKTEAEFARILQARMDRGEIVSFDYEGLTLRWPDGMRYTPDFMVVQSLIHERLDAAASSEFPHVRLVLIEVKGAFGWQKDIVKFRAARANWPLYEFQFWQKLDGEWQQTR